MRTEAQTRGPTGTFARAKVLAILLAFALAASGVACDDPVPPRVHKTPLEQMVEQIEELVPHRLQAEGINGAAVAIVGPEGFAWARGFGHTDWEKTREVDADTLFALQSGTKLFTAAAVMSAVDDGLLDLDAPISRWLPDFTVRTRFVSRPQDRITLRLLLAHRAGLTHEAPVGNNLSASEASFDAHVASIADTWLRFPVADRTAYSNLGVDLAGAVLQRVSQQAYAEVVRRRVLEPAGMHRSSFATEALRAEENRAIGDFGDPASLPLVIPIQASGGLYSSANDLARFLRIVLRHGAPIVTPESWAEMQRIAFPVSSFQSSGMGLGLFVYLRADDRIVTAGHGGSGYGFQSELIWLPELDLGIAVLLNSSNASGLAREITRILEETARKQSGRDPFLPGSALAAVAPCHEVEESTARRALGAFTSRTSNVMLSMEATSFGLYGRGGFTALCAVTDEVMISPEKQLHDAWRLEQTDGRRVTRLTGLNSGTVYQYNDGPGDLPGPGHPQWRDALGTWRYAWLGSVPVYLPLYERRGALYFDDLRLTEFEPGRFFASNGEVLDLSTEPGTWRSVPIQRDTRQSQDGGRAALDRARAHYGLLQVGDYDGFREASSVVLRSNLGDRLPTIWRDVLEANGTAGAVASGRADAAGERTHVRLAVSFEQGVRTLNLMLDADGRPDGFWLSATPPRSWWLAHSEPRRE
jgi:CubicO group peptidase (beta-lactamase class C family)